jgi:hypothetical protein
MLPAALTAKQSAIPVQVMNDISLSVIAIKSMLK